MQKIHNPMFLLCLLASEATAGPFHGCTFYKERLLAESWPGGQGTGCFDVKVGNIGSCSKPNPPWPSRPAIRVTAWYPAYIVEVSFRVGSSIFATGVDTAALAAHIRLAEQHWTRSLKDISPAKSMVSVTGDQNQTDASLMFGRVLDVPYAATGWSFTFGSADSTNIPACYRGISEFSPETWNDTFTSGDRKIAALWAPANVLLCGAGAPIQGAAAEIGAAVGAVSQIPIPGGQFPTSAAGCAVPLPVWAQQAGSLTGPTALDPARQCMGTLGPVLPRTGWTQSSDLFSSSQQVAWRTLSLTAEHQPTGVSIAADDKWQIIWPPVESPRCFTPGGLTRPTNILPNELLKDRLTGAPVPLPFSDTNTDRKGRSVVVFAVWKRKTSCQEAAKWGAIQADITAGRAVRINACRVANRLDGMP